MNIFDILSKDERIIVYSSEEDGYLYTWNQSLTLQCWGWFADPLGYCDWQELDIRTLSNELASFQEARKAAIEWHTSSNY